MARIDGHISLCGVNNGVPEYDRFTTRWGHAFQGQTTRVPAWKGQYKWQRWDEWKLGLITLELYQHRGNKHWRIDLQKLEGNGSGTFSIIDYKSEKGMDKAWSNLIENILATVVVHGMGWATSAIKTTSYSENKKHAQGS